MPQQLTIFDIPAPIPKRVYRARGPFLEDADHARLGTQLQKVIAVMRCGRWFTLRELSDLTGAPEASVSARLRDLTRYFGAGAYELERVGNGYRYRVVPERLEGR